MHVKSLSRVRPFTTPWTVAISQFYNELEFYIELPNENRKEGLNFHPFCVSVANVILLAKEMQKGPRGYRSVLCYYSDFPTYLLMY